VSDKLGLSFKNLVAICNDGTPASYVQTKSWCHDLLRNLLEKKITALASSKFYVAMI
jgi:hypothetical protein